MSHVEVNGDTDDLQFFKDDNYVCTGSGRYGIAILNITDLNNAYLICKFKKILLKNMYLKLKA